MGIEPYEKLEDMINNPEEGMYDDIGDYTLTETFMDPKVLKSILLHGINPKQEKIKLRLSQKDCEECGESVIQKDNMDFFDGKFLCESCFIDKQ